MPRPLSAALRPIWMNAPSPKNGPTMVVSGQQKIKLQISEEMASLLVLPGSNAGWSEGTEGAPGIWN